MAELKRMFRLPCQLTAERGTARRGKPTQTPFQDRGANPLPGSSTSRSVLSKTHGAKVTSIPDVAYHVGVEELAESRFSLSGLRA